MVAHDACDDDDDPSTLSYGDCDALTLNSSGWCAKMSAALEDALVIQAQGHCHNSRGRQIGV